MLIFLKKHRGIFSFIAGALVTYGIFWWFTPALSTDLNSIKSFNDCSLAGFTVYQNSDEQKICVLPNGRYFTSNYM